MGKVRLIKAINNRTGKAQYFIVNNGRFISRHNNYHTANKVYNKYSSGHSKSSHMRKVSNKEFHKYSKPRLKGNLFGLRV